MHIFKRTLANWGWPTNEVGQPLHFAARFGQLETAKVIKESGGDLNITNGEGKTASEVASFWGNDEIAKLLAPAKVESATEAVATSSPYPDNYTAVFAGNPLNR